MSQDIGGVPGVAPGDQTKVEPGATNQGTAPQLPTDETAQKVKDLEEQFNKFRSVKDREVNDAQRRAREAEAALAATQAEQIAREQEQYNQWAATADPADKLKADLDRANRQWGLHAAELNRQRLETEKWQAAARHGLDPAKVEAVRSPTELQALIGQAQAEKERAGLRETIRKEVEAEYAKRNGQPAPVAQPGGQPAKIVNMQGRDTGVTDQQAMDQAIQDFQDRKITKAELAKKRADFQKRLPAE